MKIPISLKRQKRTFDLKFTTLFLRYLFSLFFFIVFWSGCVFAQVSSCIFSSPVRTTFNYTSDNSETSATSNEMLSHIAEDKILNVKQVSFTMSARLTAITQTGADGDHLAILSFANKQLYGDIHYRRFSMEKVMIPVLASFSMRITKKDSSSSFEMPATHDLNWIPTDTLPYKIHMPWFSCDSDTVIISKIHFTFDNAADDKFRQRVTLINDYYAASSILDTLTEMMKKVEPGRISRYPLYFIELEEVNKILVFLKEKDYPGRLALNLSDPADFVTKFGTLQNLARSVTLTFRENLREVEAIKSELPLDTLSERFLDRIFCYIRWSLLVSERNSGIYREFLEQFYILPGFSDERDIVRGLADKMFPEEDRNSVFSRASKMINKVNHDRAMALMNAGDYAEAIEMLRNAQFFAEINPYLRGTLDDRRIITRAANGIYESYLGVADMAINNGKEEMARAYMLRAQNYRRTHSSYVTSDSLFREVFGRLVTGSLSICDSLYADSLYPEALQCYSEFVNGFDSLTLSIIRSGIDPKINFCRYHTMVLDGETSMSKLNLPEAGRNFFLARQFAYDNKITVSHYLDSLCRLTYPYYLVDILKSGEIHIWTGRIGEAAKFADSVGYLQRTTGVQSSRELSDALAGYRRKLNDLICWKARENAEILTLRAREAREVKHFIQSAILADSAISISRQYPDCEVAVAGLEDTLKKYSAPVQYQLMVEYAYGMVKSGDYDHAVSLLAEAGRLYKTWGIERFGLDSLPLSSYIKATENSGLMISAVKYYQSLENAYLTFEYIKMLRLQNYPREKVRLPLEWAGKEFARADFRDRPDQNPVDRVRVYTGEDSWMMRFRFSYYSEARKLRHNSGLRYILRKYFP